ncbi:hemolysin III family protein [Pseudarthrobacter sulfonivorans]|uniref:PAQR family membrane homeostasis protein TrhA n=1 Tax=Pseudarthrobacter sulfonivorans TaxID=121292 RepID=UPI00168A5C72|nr:hemolysin III family protein [Pseudarthrobacter sulfonivorans]
MNSQTPDARRAPGSDGHSPVDDAAVRLAELLMIKPRWRGWIHTVAAPLALVAGIILVAVAPTTDRKITSAIYAATGVLLFGVSAVYHRGNWSPRVKMVLKRLDHTNIMLVIAGSYTPLAWSLLEQPKAVLLLWVIWSGAILGVLFRLLWTGAPRWLYVPIYIALGCGSLFYLPEFFAASVPAAVLICVGGVLYITGAVFYALKKPNFSYQHFGFHELFHALTVFAFGAHFAAILIAVLS